jgi:molybdenum cofactor cytidylyltransferase
MVRVGAVILAAGRGERMGGPKWKLPVNGTTFLAQILRRVRDAGIADVVVVTSPENQREIQEHHPNVTIAVNLQPARGVLSSMRSGAEHLPTMAGCFIIPVDHPDVRTETYRTLQEAFAQQPEAVMKPVFQNAGGHPLVIPLAFARELPLHDVEGGLRALILDSGLTVQRVTVDDPAVLHNLNEPSDLLNP